MLKWRKVALSNHLEQFAKMDPWADRGIINLATQTATRIRLQYNSKLEKWDQVVDEGKARYLSFHLSLFMCEPGRLRCKSPHLIKT